MRILCCFESQFLDSIDSEVKLGFSSACFLFKLIVSLWFFLTRTTSVSRTFSTRTSPLYFIWLKYPNSFSSFIKSSRETLNDSLDVFGPRLKQKVRTLLSNRSLPLSLYRFSLLDPILIFQWIPAFFHSYFSLLKDPCPPALIMLSTTFSPTLSSTSSARFQLSAETSTLYFGAAITENSILASLASWDFLLR